MGTKVRVLTALLIGTVGYQANQVVDLDPALAKSLAKDGQVDPSKEAVAYCINELGEKVIVHQQPESEAVIAARAQVATLQADLDAAVEENKPAIAEKLAAQAELDKLLA